MSWCVLNTVEIKEPRWRSECDGCSTGCTADEYFEIIMVLSVVYPFDLGESSCLNCDVVVKDEFDGYVPD